MVQYSLSELREIALRTPDIEGNKPLWLTLGLTPRKLLKVTMLCFAPFTLYYIANSRFSSLAMQVLSGLAVLLLGFWVIQTHYEVLGEAYDLFCVEKPEGDMGTNRLFKDREDYTQFRKRAQQILFRAPHNDALSIVIGIGIYIILPITGGYYFYVTTGDIMFAIFEVDATLFLPWAPFIKVVSWLYWSFICTGIIGLAMSFGRVYRVTSLLSSSYSSFTVFGMIEWLNKQRMRGETTGVLVTAELCDTIRRIGHHVTLRQFACQLTVLLARVTMLALLFGFIAMLYNLLMAIVGVFNPARLIAGLLMCSASIVFGIAFFIHPQLRMHSLMFEYKESIVNLLQDAYEACITDYITAPKDVAQSKDSEIEYLNSALDYHRDLGTWPYAPLQMLRVISLASIILGQGVIDALRRLLVGG
ncbi:MAG: hypothetical protein HXY34_07740 [Candidatus Thorarchaeota archaeon]|nr:hypothetical protein [Candidatus Thorarchaeota archaeon]